MPDDAMSANVATSDWLRPGSDALAMWKSRIQSVTVASRGASRPSAQARMNLWARPTWRPIGWVSQAIGDNITAKSFSRKSSLHERCRAMADGPAPSDGAI